MHRYIGLTSLVFGPTLLGCVKADWPPKDSRTGYLEDEKQKEKPAFKKDKEGMPKDELPQVQVDKNQGKVEPLDRQAALPADTDYVSVRHLTKAGKVEVHTSLRSKVTVRPKVEAAIRSDSDGVFVSVRGRSVKVVRNEFTDSTIIDKDGETVVVIVSGDNEIRVTRTEAAPKVSESKENWWDPTIIQNKSLFDPGYPSIK